MSWFSVENVADFYHLFDIKNWISVDISHCGLTAVSRVITWMTCSGSCFKAVGSDKIYNFSNERFRVYVHQLDYNGNIVNFAQTNKYELHYEVKGICTQNSGSALH